MSTTARPMTVEEQVPLFDAIHEWSRGNVSQRMTAVVAILAAVRDYGTAVQREAQEQRHG